MRLFTFASLLTCLFAFAFNAQAITRKPAKAPAGAVAKIKPVSALKAKPKAAPKAVKAVAARPEAAKLVTLTGIVLGQNGLALPGTSVIPSGKLGAMVITNENGEFTLTLPAAEAANLNLKFAYEGLGDWNVKVQGGSKAPVLVTMLPKGM